MSERNTNAGNTVSIEDHLRVETCLDSQLPTIVAFHRKIGGRNEAKRRFARE
jgi:hypothetical protein